MFFPLATFMTAAILNAFAQSCVIQLAHSARTPDTTESIGMPPSNRLRAPGPDLFYVPLPCYCWSGGKMKKK